MDASAPSQQLYGTLVNAINEVGDGVAVLDGERFQFVNRALVRMVRYEAHELLAAGFSVRTLFAPETAEAMGDRLDRRLAGTDVEERYETVLRAKDGTRVSVEVAVRPIHGPGRALRFAILRDVTTRKRAEVERERARKDMAQTEKLAALGSLVSGVAHEIRTPLVFIQNNASILESRLALLAPACPPGERDILHACLREIGVGVDRIHRLVRDLHRFSRMPAGEFAPTDLADAVDEAARLWVATHPGANVTLDAKHEPQAMVRVDRAKIQQVILNLIQNAAEAMPDGGRVTIRTLETAEGARIVIRDEGPGISEETRGFMFEPLYTTKPGSMGLGLSVAKRIVELHRGRIDCESPKDASGTTFIVTLPRASTLPQ
ncbi:MAG TPA: ATP-binding protein [Candidatus Thermoplasmatota archaeon]|nr:ATP-binding protein [Candidatus Thermoplasmatota archaeon]